MLSLALAHAKGVAQLSSSQLANGLGANPSLVRKLLVPLANAGLVHATYGRDGGTRLGRSANSIRLREIYSAVIGEKSIWAPRAVTWTPTPAPKPFVAKKREVTGALLLPLNGGLGAACPGGAPIKPSSQVNPAAGAGARANV
jgi:DNA-binding IscR family transcriptional regulator